MTYNLTKDVNIEVYPEGITPESAEEFMKDCDYVLDQMDFTKFVIDMHYIVLFENQIAVNSC